MRSIVAKGPETRERFIRTSQEYRHLWRAGKLDSPEMAKLFAEWCAWLQLVGISVEDDPALQDLLRSDCLKKFLPIVSRSTAIRNLRHSYNLLSEAEARKHLLEGK